MKKPFTAVSIAIALMLVFASVATGLPIDPYPSAPLCVVHDLLAYHGLWDFEAGCHYNHTHGDDPHQLDALLGTSIYAEMGGSISYPWQTYTAAGTENDLKHQGYYWVVRQNLSCNIPVGGSCITDFRAVSHFHADGHDTPVRFHSMFMQARVCWRTASATNCGLAQMGGWQDTGDLLVNGVTIIDNPNNNGCHKQHRSTDGNAVWYPCLKYGEAGGEGFGRVSFAIHDEWDVTSPTAPGVYTDTICYGNRNCTNNGSYVRPHLIKVDVPGGAVEDLLDPDNNNVIESFSGFTTPYGVIDPACVAVSAVCVPLKFENVAVNYSYIYRDIDLGRDYDIYFCGGVWCTATSPGRQTSAWIEPLH